MEKKIVSYMDEQPIANFLCEVFSTALIINLINMANNWLFIHITYSPLLYNV